MAGIVSQLTNLKTYKALVPAYMALVFYLVVMVVTSTLGYTIDKKDGFTYGLVFGVAVSLVLWFQYGRKMAYQ
tara:strand:- start:2052 stop:2270 length:219 start_codon:yes stop_codon:yes gene_type:complete